MNGHGGRRLAGLLCALALAAGVARAGDQTQAIGSSGVEGRVRSAWPKNLGHGLAPIRVELVNRSAEVRVVRLEASSWDWNVERAFEARLRLAPGESIEHELLVPVDSSGQSLYWLQLSESEETAHFGDCVGTNSVVAGLRPVLYVSERELDTGALEVWAGALGEAIAAPPPSSLGALGYAAVASAPHDVELAHARHEDLARQWGAYTSLDLVVLDADHGLPSAEQLAPLVAWARAGGELLVIGARARDEAARAPELAAWIEPRFQLTASGDQYRCGLGRLLFGAPGADPDDSRASVRAALDARLQPAPVINGQWRGLGADPRIPGLEALPLRTFALLLLVFAILIGPINFLFIRNRRRPVLLLVTIPALSAAATLLLLAYGIFFQGLDVKTASISIALLDERAHRSASLEVRQVFAGMAPDEGLAPGAGTVVCAMTRRDLDRARLLLELDEGLILKGDYLPTRITVEQTLGCERAERARLGLKLSGERLRVDNNLGADLAEFAVRTPDGRLYASTDGLRAGASVELAPAASALNAEALVENLSTRAMPLSSATPEAPGSLLPPGCYLAALKASPFRDDCGIATVELASNHVLLGVLPLGEEAWR